MKRLLTGILFLFSSILHAQCLVYFKDSLLTSKKQDPLFKLLTESSTCPTHIVELKSIMRNNGLQIQSSMVANRGRNNPAEGSFSFFESIYGVLPDGTAIEHGDFFLGYFTDQSQGIVFLDQSPANKKLLIEIIAWDKQQALYNFYELRGTSNVSTRWYYRGNSMDAYKDNKYLYRNSQPGEPHFGQRMRCSGCHNSGGPILKELDQPHNDWWTAERNLILTPNTPNQDVQALINDIRDAQLLVQDVKKGMRKLAASNSMQEFEQKLSLQEQLRPLFCTTEINLQSSLLPYAKGDVSIPSEFWLNPLLGQLDTAISSQQYQKLLSAFAMQFPETNLPDADHAWLTPVKAKQNIQAIKQLILNKTISEHFALSVLRVDYTNPLFSAARCDLIKLLPETTSTDWLTHFIENLSRQGKHSNSAAQLAYYLQQTPEIQKAELNQEINNYENQLGMQLQTEQGQFLAFQRLIDMRASVAASEISQNPLGQILEPGFRVIFPEGKP